MDCYNGVWRIQGSLAVSRGIGDKHFKTWVTAEPETKVFKINPECEFLILASDGLWDKVITFSNPHLFIVIPFGLYCDLDDLKNI